MNLLPTTLGRDLRHAVRTLARVRGFTTVCVASLGLGMGTVLAILALLRALLGTPPLINPDGLVELVVRPSGPLLAQVGDSILDTWSYPDYLDLRDGESGMAISGWNIAQNMVRLTVEEAPSQQPTMYVSSNYFATIGVALARGGGFAPSSDASLAQPEVIIGHRMWRDRFAADPNIIGRTIIVNRVAHDIVGVTPERFRGHLSPERHGNIQLWVPLSRHPRLLGADQVRLNRDVGWLYAIGRLTPGTTIARADAAVASIMTALSERYPASHQYKSGGVEEYFALGARERGDVLTAQVMFYGLSGIVLLVVCLNISGMVIVRSTMRERDVAIRLAIGATRGRLMQYHLAEALVLSLLGAALGSALIFGVPSAVAWWFDLWSPTLDLFRPDVWTALQCVALCLVASLVFGLLPALRFSRPTIVTALKDDAGGGRRRAGRVHRWTAAVQAGIAVPFLVVGGVKLDQARVTAMSELGFNPRGLFATRLNLAAAGETDSDKRVFLQRVQQNLAQARVVASVTLADGLPLDFYDRSTRVTREREASFVRAHSTRIAAGYLETLGIRLLGGRSITANDGENAERVVLLSQPLAAELFPASDPLGQRIAFALGSREQQVYTVVGVTADVVSSQIANPRPQLFVSLAQHPAPTVTAIARGSAPDESMRRAFETSVTDVDPEFVLTELITGTGLVQRSRQDLLSQSAMGGLLAGVALILAALGVYGVIGFMVATRRRELGVRVALGATRTRVLCEVLIDSLKLAAPGVAGGLVLAVLWVRIVDPAWYSLGGVEPLVYATAAVTAFLVALLAGMPAARRAAAVDPMSAIRLE